MEDEAESTTPTTPENGDSDHGFEKVGGSEHSEEPTSTTSQPDDEGSSLAPVAEGDLLGGFTPDDNSSQALQPEEPIGASSYQPPNPLMEDFDPLKPEPPAVIEESPEESEPVTSSTEPVYEPPPPSPPVKQPATEDPTPPPSPKPTKQPETTTTRSITPTFAGTSTKWMKNVDPRGNGQLLSHVLDLIYWRCPKKTGIVFASMMLVLVSLCCYSLLSVVSYMTLALLTVTFSFRVYKSVLAAVQKTNEGHPFKQILEFDINLSEDKIRPAVETVLKRINCTTQELRRLFLIEDYVDTIKFGLLLWVLTYVGGWFNGMTLLILAVVAIFTLPKVYETNQTQIDQYIDLASTQVKSAVDQIKAKLPFLKQKKQKAQ